MRRRDFLFAASSAAVLPQLGNAQQRDLPIIGTPFSGEAGTPGPMRNLDGYRRGLAEGGFQEGRDYRFEAKYANYQFERIPALLRDLQDLKVAVLIVTNTELTTAAKQVVRSIPVIFSIGSDPLEQGIVVSFNKPGGNLTGVFTLNVSLAGKRFHLLRELVPTTTKFAFLTNPASPQFNEPETRQIMATAQSLGVDVLVLNARNPGEFDAGFETAAREGAGGLIVGTGSIFTLNLSKLQTLAARHRLPSVYGDDKAAREEGLISYGTDQEEAYRFAGAYAGRILKGEKPGDMPVQQSTKTKLVINLKTAKTLGITVPPLLLSRADEVIE